MTVLIEGLEISKQGAFFVRTKWITGLEYVAIYKQIEMCYTSVPSSYYVL